MTNIAADAPLVVEEQFCPSMPIVTYRDLDQAFALANDTIYGLCGSVWSADVPRARNSRGASGGHDVGQHARHGQPARSFGGFKQSGIGYGAVCTGPRLRPAADRHVFD